MRKCLKLVLRTRGIIDISPNTRVIFKNVLTIMSIVSSSGMLVNKDLMSKLAIPTLLVLKGKFSISLTKENASVIVIGLVEKGGGEEQIT